MTIINEVQEYRELKERVRMTNTQRSNSKKSNLIEEGKKIGIKEVNLHKKIIDNSLKP